MIRSTNLTAVQTTLNTQPVPPMSLVAKIGRPGDAVSINPQPLPPKDVFANVKGGFQALNTKGPAVGQLNLFFTAGIGSLASWHHFGGAVQRKEGSLTSESIVAAVKAANQADQLAKAEKLMEDAYEMRGNPDANKPERARAIEAELEAHQIRESVKSGLSKKQQDALSDLESTQEQALNDVSWAALQEGTVKICHDVGDVPAIQSYTKDYATADAEFKLGVQENKSLINSILA